MKTVSTSRDWRRKIVVSSLAVVLIMSIFVAAQERLMPRSHSANETLPESVSRYDQGVDMQLVSPDVQKTNAAKSLLSQDSASGNLQSSSTNGPIIDQLRFLVTPPMSPPPPDEVLYVDGFTDDYGEGWGWNYEGTAPYINAVGDASYVWTDAADMGGDPGYPGYYPYTGKYSFQNTTLESIGWGRIEAYAQWDEGGIDLDADLYIRHGDTAPSIWAGSIEAGTAWSWVPTTYVTEIPSDFLTPAEINSLTLRYIIYWTPDDLPAGVIQIDAIRLSLWKEPWPPPSASTAKVQALKNGQLDAATDLLTTEEIDSLDESCFTITQDLQFHIFHIGFNIRSDQSYRTDRPGGELPYVAAALSDVDFRHALIHCYDQLSIIPSIYGYTVTPIRSLVPPAQAKYYSSAVQAHPYNPGNPFTSPPGEHSSCGILKAAGYTFVDAGTIGVVDPADYWTKAGFGGAPLPNLRLFTPTIEVAPTSYQHGAEIINDLHAIGLNNFEQVPEEFGYYSDKVFQNAEFDMYMIGWGLGRLPDQLYNMLHSSQDCHLYPSRRNSPGVNDATIDTLTEAVMFSLNPDDIEVAAKEVQLLLYDPSNDYAFAYMQLYSKSAFNAFNPGLRGVVKSPGFGSNNMWTFLNMRWEPGHPYQRIEDDMSTVIWGLNDEPESFNPTYTSTVNAWTILDRTHDELTVINPYSHYDVPWIATDWTITETVGGMDIDFTIRSDVEWQDGKPVTAYDIEWCLEFLRDREIPQYYSSCAHIIDVIVTDNTHFTIQCDEAGLSLFYDLSSLGVLLPRHIWDRAWASNQEVLDYDPTEAYNVATGYTDGPHPTPTNVMGTGPFVFQFYDTVNQYSDLWENPYYFKTEADIAAQIAYMFWEIGDANRNGVVDQNDYDLCTLALGSTPGDPNWDPDCDFNHDDFIGLDDVDTVNYHMGWQLEYPDEIVDVAVLDVNPFPAVVYPGQEINITVMTKNKGNAGFTTNFTCYYNNTFMDSQTVANLIPCHNATMNFLWDTTSVSPGIYTISVNATVLDGSDANLTDNIFISRMVKIGMTKISVEPQKSIVGSAGKSFSINVTITDAPYNATWAWQFKLSWNASLLDIIDITEGAFLSQDGMWITAFANLTNQEEGWVLLSCTLTDNPIQHGQPLPDDNATLATISFVALDLGDCTINLSDTVLLNYNIDPYFHTTQDGEFEVLLGDTNRDGIVDDEDIEIIKLAYGAVSGSPDWNPEADIWGPDDEPDGIIDVYDLAMCGKRFGESA